MAKESIAIVGVGLLPLIGRYSFRLPEHLEWGVWNSDSWRGERNALARTSDCDECRKMPVLS